MIHKKATILVALLLVLAASVYLGMRRNALPQTTPPSEGAPPADTRTDQLPVKGTKSTPTRNPVIIRGLIDDDDDEEINRLREFLDSNDNNAIVEQAAFLASCDDSRRREEAIEALTWVATPKAGMALLPLLNDQDEEIAENAFGAMQHVLATIAVQINGDAETGELTIGITRDDGQIEFDTDDDALDVNEAYALWLNAIRMSPSEDDAETLLISLAGIDAKFSVPLLTDLQEDGNPHLSKLATEYLDMTTNRTGVTNREQAAEWLMQQEQNTP